MKKMTLFSLFFLFVSSCGTLSNNRFLEGETNFSGGQFKSQKWGDDLTFKRYSWFQELSLLFEVLVAEPDENSPFWAWFSLSERRAIEPCRDFKIVMSYSLDSGKVSETSLWSQAEEAGYKRVSLPHFSNYLQLHPQYDRQSFQLYNINGLCLEASSVENSDHSATRLVINLPNYPEVEL